MELDDLKYLTSTTSNLCGIPMRIYQNRKLEYIYSAVKLPIDPIINDLSEICKINNHIGYYINKDFLYYGIINYSTYQLIIGPSRQTKMSKQELSTFAFKLGVPPNQRHNFISSMESITSMPLTAIIQILCSINFALNKEKLSLSDIIINDEQKLNLELSTDYSNDNNHNTLSIEEEITSLVENGDVDKLKEYSKSALSVNSGKLSNSQIRQMKNTFIVTCTLVSRAAIRGGLSTNDSFSLSDLYIQKCELLDDYSAILNLQLNMILDYAQKVKSLRTLDNHSKIYYDVSNYIMNHLSEPIKIEDIASSLYMNRSYLSYSFKKSTGIDLSKYIFQVKINEAKKLLKDSSNKIESISIYLGFSTHAHFTRVFKEYVGVTPKDYQMNHQK